MAKTTVDPRWKDENSTIVKFDVDDLPATSKREVLKLRELNQAASEQRKKTHAQLLKDFKEQPNKDVLVSTNYGISFCICDPLPDNTPAPRTQARKGSPDPKAYFRRAKTSRK